MGVSVPVPLPWAKADALLNWIGNHVRYLEESRSLYFLAAVRRRSNPAVSSRSDVRQSSDDSKVEVPRFGKGQTHSMTVVWPYLFSLLVGD